MVEVKKVRDQYNGGHQYRVVCGTATLSVSSVPPTEEDIEALLERHLKTLDKICSYCDKEFRKAQHNLQATTEYRVEQREKRKQFIKSIADWKKSRGK